MKKIFTILAIPFLCLNILSGQSLVESLGGIKTNFQFLSDSTNLNVTHQVIILGAEKKTYLSYGDTGGWGYGYQSFHLEFISDKELSVSREYAQKGYDYQLIFVDNNKHILATVKIPSYYFRKYTNYDLYNSEKFYSIDLINIPVLLLERTSVINIVKLR